MCVMLMNAHKIITRSLKIITCAHKNKKITFLALPTCNMLVMTSSLGITKVFEKFNWIVRKFHFFPPVTLTFQAVFPPES